MLIIFKYIYIKVKVYVIYIIQNNVLWYRRLIMEDNMLKPIVDCICDACKFIWKYVEKNFCIVNLNRSDFEEFF